MVAVTGVKVIVSFTLFPFGEKAVSDIARRSWASVVSKVTGSVVWLFPTFPARSVPVKTKRYWPFSAIFPSDAIPFHTTSAGGYSPKS